MATPGAARGRRGAALSARQPPLLPEHEEGQPHGPEEASRSSLSPAHTPCCKSTKMGSGTRPNTRNDASRCSIPPADPRCCKSTKTSSETRPMTHLAACCLPRPLCGSRPRRTRRDASLDASCRSPYPPTPGAARSPRRAAGRARTTETTRVAARYHPLTPMLQRKSTKTSNETRPMTHLVARCLPRPLCRSRPRRTRRDASLDASCRSPYPPIPGAAR